MTKHVWSTTRPLSQRRVPCQIQGSVHSRRDARIQPGVGSASAIRPSPVSLLLQLFPFFLTFFRRILPAKICKPLLHILMTNDVGVPPAFSRALPVGSPPLSLDPRRGRGSGAHASPSLACFFLGISSVLGWPAVVEVVVVVGREGGRRGRTQKWSGALLADSTFLSSHLDILTL